MSTVAQLEERAATSPLEAIDAFSLAIAEGNARAAAGCFASEACLITPDATAIRGMEEIAAVLAQLTAGGTRIQIEITALQRAGKVACGQGHSRVVGRDARMEPFEQHFPASFVLVEGEGTWRIQILCPWGSR